MKHFYIDNFADWRRQARLCLQQALKPDEVIFSEATAVQNQLFPEQKVVPSATEKSVSVPARFLALAEKIACHIDPQRWNLLYNALWRICHERKNLLDISSDPLMHRLHLMEKAVRRDAHKAKAFIRFRLCAAEGEEHYLAWHCPDHNIIRLVAPFFSRRFAVMKWTVMTPYETAHWDGEELHFSAGIAQDPFQGQDNLEEMWKAYYKATFNPARVKIKMMKQEMPVRYWKTLPEASLIPGLIRDAEKRTSGMIEKSKS